MSTVFRLTSFDGEAARDALDACVRAVADAAVVVVPTETVYGIAARADDAAATAALFDAKRRPRDLNLPVIVDTEQDAWTVGAPNDAARALAAAFWPGPLTLVLSRTGRSVEWSLGAERATVAVRVPDHPFCRELVRRAGPLAATSANISGSPPLAGDDLVRTFGDDVRVYVLADTGQGGGLPSTVVDVTASPSRVLRVGALTPDRIAAAAGGDPAAAGR